MKKVDSLLYSLQEIVNELKLNITNAVEVSNNEFTIGDITYIIEYGILNIDGTDIPHVSFNQKGNEVPNVKLGNTQAGDIFKVYSTMYKVILDYLKKKQPERFIVASYEHSGYFNVYSNLVKDNPIENYFIANKMLKVKNSRDQVLNAILLKKY